MAFEQSTAVDAWQAALEQVEGLLDFDSWATTPGLSPASAGEVEVADAVIPVLDRFAEQSSVAEAAAREISDRDERSRVMSTLAMGDIEAAYVALELSREFEDGGTVVASAGESPEVGSQTGIAADLAQVLRGGQGAGSQPDPEWLTSLSDSLDKVVERSADGIVKVGTDTVTAAVAGALVDSLARVLSGALGDLLDAVKEKFTLIKEKAVELLKKGLAKVTELFGEKVGKALQEWIDGRLDELPTQLVAAAAGVPATEQAWRSAADKGTDVASLIPRVRELESTKLRLLTWSDRGVWVYRYLAPALIGVQVVGVPGGVIVGAIALALVGWMMWAAVDHSGDARRLVAS
ncbi:hypothetical protein MLP_48540 [Microlunatus phosphovorus NM-1]|uniref:Uncharacterized protein n=1 Tax=Microlunatus phosphovorus (strain ATCC 700054 / DSM 10555 / JCM 9379 / NBRC 101784 / NCIMB 13414 / VKM Ac-1990 / NM-1) TaxID=1032480 RepID=F5XFD0_MICPN|nr:hypothetical protein [Microlunatus phosphovorus]BAK37868.1 hypothetical protein MLP_48540 [Microlunatus phosphovorus NM-1]